MELDIDAISNFFEKYKDEKVFFFGFTFVVWQYFIKAIIKSGIKLNRLNGVLIHGGGWKN